MESSNSTAAAQPAGRPHKQALAIDPSLGIIFLCDRCEHVHVNVGDLHVRTDVDGFHALVVLLNRAAANFELWAETRRRAA